MYIYEQCVTVDVGVFSTADVSQVFHVAGRWYMVLDGVPVHRPQSDKQRNTAARQAAEC